MEVIAKDRYERAAFVRVNEPSAYSGDKVGRRQFEADAHR